MQTRDAAHADLPAVAAIYAAAATSSHVTFDLEGRPLAWWEEVLADSGHPLLVAEPGTPIDITLPEGVPGVGNAR